MNPEDFKAFSGAATDFIADYLESGVRDYNVLSSVKPGYLYDLMADEMPEDSRDWQEVMDEFKTKIIPGITHWQSPNFHAYFPATTSYPAIVGDMLAGGLAVIGFNWVCSPACTELEVIVVDWLAKFLNIPENFLSRYGNGGGIIQCSASESILMGILTAREQTVKRLVEAGQEEENIRGKLVMYTSKSTNVCVYKNALLAGMECHFLKPGQDNIVYGKMLEEAVEKDIADGKIPVICVANLGTTNTCAIDEIVEICEVTKRYHMYVHVDAAYAGAALCLPEYKHIAQILKDVDFFNINLHKIINVPYECTPMWYKDVRLVEEVFDVDQLYLNGVFEKATKLSPDYRHWQLGLGRRFRALKVWSTLKVMGAQKIRDSIRKRFHLVEYFNKLIETDHRIEVVHKARLGLMTFRLKTGDEDTKKLLKLLNDSRKVFLVPTSFMGRFIIRYVAGGFDPREEDQQFAMKEIQTQLDHLYILRPNL